MGTKYPELWNRLFEPFHESDIKTKPGAGGRQLHFVTARTVANRLDDVLGPEGWRDDYSMMENSVLCRLTIVLPDGREWTKQDAGGKAGMSDSGDDDMSGFSTAFKRAAAKFGVGRHLYQDGIPYFGEGPPPGNSPVNGNGNGNGHYAAPAPEQRQASPPPAPQADGPDPGRRPQSGKALFAWSQQRGQELNVGVTNWLVNWGKEQGIAGRMVDWFPEQVERAYGEAMRKFYPSAAPPQSVAPGNSPTPVQRPPARVQDTPEMRRVKDTLYGLINEIAEIQIPGAEVTNARMAAIVAGLKARDPELSPLTTISGSTDLPLLAAYVEAAHAQLEDIRPIAQFQPVAVADDEVPY